MSDREPEPAPLTARWATPTLVNDLVTLRPFAEHDIDAAWEMVNDPEGNDLTATTESFEFDQIAAWYGSRNAQDLRIDVAVVDNATGDFAGEAVLNDYEPSSNSANFRIALRGPAWFGRGLGGAATALLVRHGLDTMQLTSIGLEVLARNERARRTYLRAGFVEVDRFVDAGIDGDEPWIRMRID